MFSLNIIPKPEMWGIIGIGEDHPKVFSPTPDTLTPPLRSIHLLQPPAIKTALSHPYRKEQRQPQQGEYLQFIGNFGGWLFNGKP